MEARKILIAALLTLTACQSDIAKIETNYKREYVAAPNSETRFSLCSNKYSPGSKQFAKCWSGELFLPKEVCTNGFRQLGNPYISDFQKAAFLSAMKKQGCV